MLYAGLRRGEFLALTWSDVDLKAKTIQVNKTVEFINNQARLKYSTKTEAGTRLISIPDVLVNHLDAKYKSKNMSKLNRYIRSEASRNNKIMSKF